MSRNDNSRHTQNSQGPSRASAHPHTDTHPSSDSSSFSTDELFAKLTVTEVRNVRQQIEADANAKQEELRLMVGERYRDLLQASSSIISMAQSSKHVLDALDETKNAILSQNLPSSLKSSYLTSGDDDSRLRAMQVLSGQIKLLLDAPEHLWRFIERKAFLSAAWLFLIARVVHRALTRDDTEDDSPQSNYGIDVLSDFPLVQRQWDIVSQFRSQIIHKATLSLRELTTPEEICAILITLHILDSRPLGDTLSTFLSQRTKSVQAVLSWSMSVPNSTLGTKHTPNGDASSTSNIHANISSVSSRGIRETTQRALNLLAHSVHTARIVFEEKDCSDALIRLALSAIQSDSHNQNRTPDCLPPGLFLTTQGLLVSLTSSSQFSLLPPNIRSYKPYVDLESSSSRVSQSLLSQKLQEWFSKSSQLVRISAEGWLNDIHSVKEVWKLRASAQLWISTSPIQDQEKSCLFGILDNICQSRVSGIWKSVLFDATSSFRERLEESLETISREIKEQQHAEFLFRSSYLLDLSSSASNRVDIHFQKYQNALKKQLVGRTVLVDSALTALEKCARTIHHDMQELMSDPMEQTRTLVERLKMAYQPAVESVSAEVVDILDGAFNNGASLSIDQLVFLSRVADDLATVSPFISDLDCGPSIVTEFQSKMVALYDRVIDRWRINIVMQIISKERYLQTNNFHYSLSRKVPVAPSPGLVRALLSLSHALQQIGVARNSAKWIGFMQATLRLFLSDWINGWRSDGEQSIYDLEFLRGISDLHGSAFSEITASIDTNLKATVDYGTTTYKSNISAYLFRTQFLFAVLLPPFDLATSVKALNSQTGLLVYGPLSTDQQHFQSAIELAKPGPRFGLLLVGSENDNRSR